MKVGKYSYRGYNITITADTKEEDINFIFKQHPEFRKTVGLDDNSKPKRKSKPDSNDKPE